jgi:hypothetical protein
MYIREEQDTNQRIGEEIGNLKDRILEEVEEDLRKEGMELNLRQNSLSSQPVVDTICLR